jgi:DNA replication and repair protein RecF
VSLVKLQLSDFRNIQQASLKLSPGLNILVGRNGSGKTSVLEAIHYLGLGRSFRTHLTGRVIRQGERAFTLFAQCELEGRQVPIGLAKDKSGETQLKIAGTQAQRLADLAELLPVQLIHPDGFNLLTGGPQARRAWLDWGVFHQEPTFFSLWGRVRRLLKQRNALLRQSTQYRPLAFWDQELVRLGADVNAVAYPGAMDATPVYAAAENGFADVVEALGRLGADVNRALNNGSTPLRKARQEGHAAAAAARERLGAR